MTDFGKTPAKRLLVYSFTPSTTDLSSTVNFYNWGVYSQMTDTIRAGDRVHPVSHGSLVVSWRDRPGRIEQIANPGFGVLYTGDRVYSQISQDPEALYTATTPHVPSDAAIASLTDEAFRALSDQVPQEVDLINFGLDLREMGSLIPSLAENMAKTVSGGFLTYSFGWKPFIGDLKKLGQLTKTVTDRLQWLRETRGRLVRLGFTGTWADEDPYTITLFGSDRPVSLVRKENKFVAGCYLYHLLERLNGIEGQLRAFSSALGLLNPSAVVWERIPFSFVADWFVRTDGIVNSLQIQPFSGIWNLRDISHSFTFVREFEIQDRNDAYSGLNGPGHTAATLVRKAYVRNPGLPVTSSILSTTGLTTGQLALAAALIGAASK
jgi:hypothetical protein